MSWQDYVDNQLLASQCVSSACIAGHDGGIWAKNENFNVSKGLKDPNAMIGRRFVKKKLIKNFREKKWCCSTKLKIL